MYRLNFGVTPIEGPALAVQNFEKLHSMENTSATMESKVIENEKVETVETVEGISVTPEDLETLMETRGNAAVALIQDKYGTVENLCYKLASNPSTGIPATSEDIAIRERLFGVNIVEGLPPVSFLTLVWRAMKDTTLIILQIAAIVSLALSFVHEEEGESAPGWIEGVAILVSVAIVVLVTAFNDWSKERQFRGLSERVAGEREAAVVRGGESMRVPTQKLLVGDLCQIQYGDQLAADGVLLHANDLRMDESALTGEADLVHKSVNASPLVFSGTNVMEGRGLMLVLAVGRRSQSGILLAMLNAAGSGEGSHSKSVLQKKLTKMAMQIGYAGSAAAVITFIVLTVRFCVRKYIDEKDSFEVGHLYDFLKFFIVGVTVLVVAVPEGLPLAVTISLAYSVRKMLKDKNLVRHLDACETMGNATTICSDKTGTLTTNRMTAVAAYIGDNFFSAPPTSVSIPTFVSRLLCEAISINSNYASRILPSEQPGELPRQIGNKTECALLGLVERLGLSYEGIRLHNPETSFVKVFTFNSARKSMTTVIPLPDGGYRLFTKGASEVVSGKCSSRIGLGGRLVPHLPEDRNNLENDVIKKMASNGLRTIGVAYKDIRPKASSHSVPIDKEYNKIRASSQTIDNENEGVTGVGKETEDSESLKSLLAQIDAELESAETDSDSEGAKRRRLSTTAEENLETDEENADEIYWDDEANLIRDLTLLAIIGVEDPVRPEVPEAISQCQNAGIVVRMVTGDNVITATSIATKCGILSRHSGGLVLDSQQFNQRIRNAKGEVQQHLMDRVWPQLRVLARSTPQDKYTLVNGIINSSHASEVVAVTGDGTNDGPALRLADVGFAMGITGTDVAKEACDIVLTDDNFTSIVKAVMWGRNVYDSIAKFLQFQLTVNIVAVTIAFVSVCIISNTPLKAVQMLWVNLIMDTLASLALATEKPTKALLKRAPYGRSTPLLSKIMITNMLGQAAFMITVIFVLLFYADDLLSIESALDDKLNAAPSQHFTFIFNVFVMMTLFNEINARKVHGELNVFRGIQENPVFYIIWLVTFFAQVLIVQLGGYAFSTAALTLDQWLWCLFFGILTLFWQMCIVLLRALFRKCVSLHRKKSWNRTSVDPDSFALQKMAGVGQWIYVITGVTKQMTAVKAFQSAKVGDGSVAPI